MREKLVQDVRSLFQNMPDTPRNRDLQEEILQNTLDRYDDLISRGASETDAYVQASASIGDVRGLWEHAPAEKPKKKRRTLLIVLAVLLAALLLLGAAVTELLDELRLRRNPMKQAEETVEQWADRLEEKAEQWAEGVEQSVKEHVAAASGNEGFRADVTYRNSDSYTAGSAAVAAADVRQLRINWLSGSVTIAPYDGDTVQMEETGAADPAHALRWLLEGPYLTVQYAAEGSYRDLPAKSLIIRVPKDMIFDRIGIDSVSANADLRDIQTKSLLFETTSGNLNAVGQFGRTEIDSVSGQVSFHGTASDLELDTTSGDASVTLTEPPGTFSFDGVSGDLKLWLPENCSFELEYDTVSGDVDCAFATTRAGEAWFYRSTVSPAAELDLETVSGDMEILILK